ncbi:MAG TPA: metal ABC transporter ATP-binding protein [Acidimicrobiales bacterium]|nr:metal ABC transporter ATP-binding protein [Acidimicrobiales bacterium]
MTARSLTEGPPVAPVLAVDHASVVLAGRRVLDEVSFTVAAGQFTGLIGSNGAGKTTLLRAILGLQRLSGGRIDVADGSGRHRAIGYVPQKVVLDPDLPMRARDMVELGIGGNRLGFSLPSRARRARVDELLAAVGAQGFADSRVGRLSGGELQRILIAHALIGQPRLLLLDEPLANLDLSSGQEVVELLHRIATEHQVAVLLSAHEINPLLPVLDRLVYLADGRAVTGTVDEVVRSDVLSALYGHHVDVLRVHGRVLVVVGPGSDDGDKVAPHDAIEVG